MGICCQKPIAVHNDPHELPEIREFDRGNYTSSISAGIHSEDLYGNRVEEEVDDQIFQIFHSMQVNIGDQKMNMSLLEKNDLINISIS